MRKLIVLIVVAAAALLLIGLPNLVYSVRYRQPAVIDFDQPVPAILPAYVRLQHIRLLASEAMQGSSRRGSKVYIPVRPADTKGQERISVVLESDDPELLMALARLGGKTDIRKEIQVMGVFAHKTEATGMSYGYLDPEDKAALTEASPLLEKDFVVVREGESPSLALAVLTLGNAAALLVLLRWIWKRRQAAQQPAEPPLL